MELTKSILKKDNIYDFLVESNSFFPVFIGLLLVFNYYPLERLTADSIAPSSPSVSATKSPSPHPSVPWSFSLAQSPKQRCPQGSALGFSVISGTSKALITISNFSLHSRSGLRQGERHASWTSSLGWEAKTNKFKCVHQSATSTHFLFSEFPLLRNGAESTLPPKPKSHLYFLDAPPS